jgi:predicted aldo/keto reductase-like oxidoreductase
MTHHECELHRRAFLKTGVAAGALALGTVSAQGQEKPASRAITSPLAVPNRPFGKTGHSLPVLGFGGAPLTVIFSRAYGITLPSKEERVALVRYAFDQGLRYFDTARVYGESESIIGKAIAGIRDQIYLATKIHAFRPEDVRKMVETSLKQLGTDYLDAVQIHSPSIERVGFDGGMKLQAELVKLRDEKMIRFIGLTTHVAFEDVLRMIQTDGFDQVLLAYGYFRRGMDSILSHKKIEAREECLAAAYDRGMGIVAMKVLGANIMNHNSPNIVSDFDKEQRKIIAGAAIRWTLQDERVSMLNIGHGMNGDVDANIATLTGDTRLTNTDRQILARFSKQAYESEYVKAMKVT